MITKLQITGKLHYHRKCDFQLSKRKLGYRTLLPLTAPIRSIPSVPSSLDLSSDATATSSILDNSTSNQHAQPDCNNFSSHFSNYTWFAFNRKVARFMFPTVLLANVRGSLCTKNDELSVLFSNNSVDIACLTETWLNDGIIDDLIHIPGYCVHRRDRQDGRQGGVVARNSLLATVPA